MSKWTNISIPAIAFLALSALMATSGFAQDSGSTAKKMSDKDQMEKKDTMAKSEMGEGFAMFELFTSEGCSSCPSADKNLARIAEAAQASGQNVYTLSYHVDYWDRLGWKDPYGDRGYTNRQRQYARQFDSDRVYTPQMVVNGVVEFVGSNQKNSTRATELALKREVDMNLNVSATVGKTGVTVDWDSTGLEDQDVINVALVQNHGQQNVTRGENARRKLAHVNIVRDLKTVDEPSNMGVVQLELPEGFEPDKFHIVAFVQSPTFGIRTAARSEIQPDKMDDAQTMKKQASKEKMSVSMAGEKMAGGAK